MAGALYDIEGCAHQRTTAEGENHGVGGQRTDPAVAEPRNIQAQGRPDELGGNEGTYRHANDAPEHGHYRELPAAVIVVDLGCSSGPEAGGNRSSCGYGIHGELVLQGAPDRGDELWIGILR